MLKYMIYHNISTVEKIKINRESKYYVWLKSGLKLRKETDIYSIHDSFDAAKYALIGKCTVKVLIYEGRMDYYNKLISEIVYKSEEDFE